MSSLEANLWSYENIVLSRFVIELFFPCKTGTCLLINMQSMFCMVNKIINNWVSVRLELPGVTFTSRRVILMWRISLQWHLYRNRNNWCKNEFTGEKGKSGQFCDMFAKYVDNAPIMCAWYLIRNFQIKKRNYTIYQHVYLILFGNGAWTPTEKNEDLIWLFIFSDS